jgi:hypothetical protein
MRIASFLRTGTLSVILAASVSSVAAADTCVVGPTGGCGMASASRARTFVAALTGSTTRAATSSSATATGTATTADERESSKDVGGIRGVSMGSRSLALLFALGTGSAIALLQSSGDHGSAAPAPRISEHGGTEVSATHPPEVVHPPVVQVTHPPVFDAHVVPEPVTMTLLATGLASMGGMGALRRRRRSTKR